MPIEIKDYLPCLYTGRPDIGLYTQVYMWGYTWAYVGILEYTCGYVYVNTKVYAGIHRPRV